MSGGIFSPLENLCDLDNANCHPLVCFLCHEQYEHPCLLDCYHNFCASCLRGRAIDSRLICPLCGQQSIVKGNNGLPPEDRLLKFLLDSSGDCEEEVQCANCDLECKKQEMDTMYFCNTCNQPLCSKCREETHKAKMFSCHEIVSLTKHTKDIHKKCPLHETLANVTHSGSSGPPSFRESRAHCIDIETAYMQGCEKLDQAVMAVKELQTSTREAIVLLKAMIEEVRNSADEEETSINSLFSNMQVRERTWMLFFLCPSSSQYEEKEKAFKEQLSHLASLLPTLQVHLVTCSAFLSSANKAEFLDLGYVNVPFNDGFTPLVCATFQINTEYRTEFAHCLEPLLLLNPRRSVVVNTLMVPGCPSSCDKMSITGSIVRKPTMHRYISTKVLLAEGGETPFTEHCRNYENMYRTLQTEIQILKDQVQELHRDLTKHHSLIKTEIMSEILQKSLQVDVQIASEYSSVEMMRSAFEEIWEETYQRVANEQEIYEAQLHDLLQLKQENSCLTTITKQIAPYVRSIAKVKERLEPRFCDNARCLFYSRNDLASGTEESKEKATEPKVDNRTLNILAEDPQLKNKDYYRSKQKNEADSPSRKELATKENSAKEPVACI
uniref:RING finger protein 207 n=1 Tax=Sphenodon punctatus TaxID=8508 RepID=A0A8D0H2X5_SPHPU